VSISGKVNSTGQSRWYVAALCFLTFLCASIDRHILGLLVEPMQRDLGISDMMFGLMAGGGFLLLYVIASFPAGRLVDAKSRPHLLAGAVLIWSLATLTTGLASTFAGIFLLRMMVGFGEAMVGPASNSMVADLFDRHYLARALSLLAYGGTLGAGLTSILTSTLYALAGGDHRFALPLLGDVSIWQAVFIIAGLPGLVLAPLLWFTVRDPPRRRVLQDAGGQPVIAGLSQLVRFLRARQRLCLWMLCGYGCYSIASSSLMVWLPTYFVRAHAMPVRTVGLWLGCAYIGIGLVTMLLNSRFIDKRLQRGQASAPIRLARAYAIAGIIPAISLSLIDRPILALLTGGALLFLASGFLTVSIALPRLWPNQIRGQVTALHLIVFHTAGGMGGPLLIGMANDMLFGPQAIGTSLSLLISPMLIAAGAFLSLSIVPYERAAHDIDRISN